MRELIFNADDFGYTRDINDGIVQAHREGVLTSTTLMANGREFGHAVTLAHATPSLDIGVHLVLVGGVSVVTGKLLPKSPAYLPGALLTGSVKLESELRAQIEKVIAAGLRPTHLDTHKHTHLLPQVFRAVVRLAAEFEIPYVRLPLDPTVRIAGLAPTNATSIYKSLARRCSVSFTDNFLGFHLTGRLTEVALLQALAKLPAGVTEFMCHPGLLTEELAAAPTRLKESRQRELEALVSPRVREFIRESAIQLRPFLSQRGMSN